jgi:hypothetical protein
VLPKASSACARRNQPSGSFGSCCTLVAKSCRASAQRCALAKRIPRCRLARAGFGESLIASESASAASMKSPRCMAWMPRNSCSSGITAGGGESKAASSWYK